MEALAALNGTAFPTLRRQAWNLVRPLADSAALATRAFPGGRTGRVLSSRVNGRTRWPHSLRPSFQQLRDGLCATGIPISSFPTPAIRSAALRPG